jgi:hypothetical protein
LQPIKGYARGPLQPRELCRATPSPSLTTWAAISRDELSHISALMRGSCFGLLGEYIGWHSACRRDTQPGRSNAVGVRLKTILMQFALHFISLLLAVNRDRSERGISHPSNFSNPCSRLMNSPIYPRLFRLNLSKTDMWQRLHAINVYRTLLRPMRQPRVFQSTFARRIIHWNI